ncbi:MAG: DNA-processing protein DprA [Desulfobulbaceae bacterium]|nr:DNA-processing protein DprA [Desulfobulbaceae bacterium]
MSDNQRTIDWLRLSLTPGLGAAGCRRLVEHFGTPGRVLAAPPAELARVGGIRKTSLNGIGAPEIARAAETALQRTHNAGQTLLCWDDPGYPEQLRTIHDPPVLLYLKGAPAVLNNSGIAVVGARAASTYGLQMAGRFARDLALRGLTIISGLALGIDSNAHAGALAAAGKTVAVLGCGLDIVYPARNRKLFEEIAATGALVSEYPPGTPPDSFRFPARNRIISGLALGVLVVEAAKHSGSLITAQLALEQGREVFAMPGRIDSGKSEGTHRLLQDGAKLVHSVDDILAELQAFTAAAPTNAQQTTPAAGLADLDQASQALLATLDVYPKNIDDLIVATGLAARVVNEKLVLLELADLIEVLPGKLYQRKA